MYGHFADLGGLLEALVERGSRRALAQFPGTYDDLLGACLEAVRTGPRHLAARADAPRGRAAAPARADRGRPRRGDRAARAGDRPGHHPELSAHMLSAYADEAARLTLNGYSVERILALTRWALEPLR